MSLSGGLIPLGGQSKSSGLADMAPLESLGRTKSAPVSGGFDDLDDLLNAPSRTSKKSKSKKVSKKKGSSKKKFNVDDSGDFGSPASKGSSAGPLSPNLGDSFEHDAFRGIEPPRGTGAADLDDSILGGLLSGPSKAPMRGVTRAKTSGSILGGSNAPSSPGSTFITKDKYRSDSTGSPLAPKSYQNDDDFIPAPTNSRAAATTATTSLESTIPAASTSTSSAGNTRPSMRSFSSVPNIDRTSDGPSSARTRPSMTKHSSITSFATDADELSMDFDIDSLLPGSSNTVDRPPTNAGRKQAQAAKDPWSDDLDTESFPSTLTQPRHAQRSTTAPAQSSSTRGQEERVVPASTTSAGASSSRWNDDINDDDFDVDALLPDNEPSMHRHSKSVSSSSTASVHFSPDVTKPRTSDSRNREGESPQTLPTAAPLSRGRSAPVPSISTAKGVTDSSESPERNAGSSGATTEQLPNMQQPRSRSSSPLVVGGQSAADSPPHAAPAPSDMTKRQAPTEDEVDIGFMPSFLDPNRDPPRGRRQLGKAKSTRGRINGNNFADGDSDFDALDKALGIGGELGGGITPRTGGRVVKAVDPFGHADTLLDKKIHRPSTEHINRSDTGPVRSQHTHIVDKPQPTTDHISDNITSSTGANTAPSASLSIPQSTGLSHSSLPSLTPTKPDVSTVGVARAGNTTTDAALDSSLESRETNARTSRRSAGNVEHTISKTSAANTQQNQQQAHSHPVLSIRVDNPSDLPMSNPPTITTITPGSGQKRSSSLHELSSPSGANTSATASGIIVNDHAPTRSTSIGNSLGEGKRVIKKANSSFELSPTPAVSGSRPHSTPGQDKYQDNGSPSPAKRNDRMPSWLSPNGSIDLSGPTGGRDASVRQLQQKVDELSVQKDTIEKYLRLEIDTLKHQLEHSGGGHNHQSSDSSGMGTSRNFQEIDDLRYKIRELTKENLDLKEEAMVEKLKHQKEITYLREKHQADIEAGNTSRADEIAMLERRHNDAITALKKIHLDEIAAVKQRAKDGVALEQLSSQITHTTGSLKLIEEQMSLQYRGIDAVREGQFEARERLLVDMETKARERAEAAESEGYKLKGLLGHMEQVVQNLRSQGGEERERLKMEHRRLEAMYSNLEAERRALQDRTTDELTEMKRKVAMAEAKAHEDMKYRAEQQAELNELRRKLEADKKEFAVYVSSNVKAAEHSTEQLKAEEDRLVKLRASIMQEKASLDKKKEEAITDLRSAEVFRSQISKARDEIQREKREMQQVASELQALSDTLIQQDEELKEREQSLRQREAHVTEEARRAEYSQRNALLKEQEIMTVYQQTESQRAAMKDLEEDFQRRKVALAYQRRELTRLQSDADKRNLYTSLNRDGIHDDLAFNYGAEKENVRVRSVDVGTSAEDLLERLTQKHSPIDVNRTTFGSGNKAAPMRRPRTSYESAVPENDSRGLDYHSQSEHAMNGEEDNSASTIFGIDRLTWESEVASARRTMQAARGGVAKAAMSRYQNDGIIKTEKEFLSRIRNK